MVEGNPAVLKVELLTRDARRSSLAVAGASLVSLLGTAVGASLEVAVVALRSRQCGIFTVW